MGLFLICGADRDEQSDERYGIDEKSPGDALTPLCRGSCHTVRCD